MDSVGGVKQIYRRSDIRTFDEFGDVLANERYALRLRVGTDGAYLSSQFLRSRNNVSGEHMRGQLHEGWVLHQRSNLVLSFMNLLIPSS
jgi:hypothetical protein